jgi:hypothetical protein
LRDRACRDFAHPTISADDETPSRSERQRAVIFDEGQMNRSEFEALRNLSDKVIRGDIVFSAGRKTAPLLIAEDIHIENSHGVDARLTIQYNPEVGSITFNVHVVGVGPICRLDVRGKPHRPAGRSHKHALKTERCPDRNLPDDVLDRPELLEKTTKELFEEFCALGHINHTDGAFRAPDEDES